MDADFMIELGQEDPVLDFPWIDPEGKFAYIDVKRHPELVAQIEETERFPELGEFLLALNSARSAVETVKCDAWATTELSVEEDIYDASHKVASYVDMVFSEGDVRFSFSAYEQFARKLVELLRRVPETPSAVEICVRRCFFVQNDSIREGFYCTLYLSGYGGDEDRARLNWGGGLKLLGNAIVQLSAFEA